ncbi:MAG: PKD domain-containing protein, partial [Sediminicola sp.]
GCPATIHLEVLIDNTTDGCPNFLRNENEALVLGEGRLSGNLDVAVGTPFNTNGSPCALEVSNVDPNQAFARYEVSLNLNQLGILPGHELYISLDADATNGRGRLEVSRDNVTNSSILDHTFTGGWSTFEGRVTVPSGITTLDLWFFSNYNQQTAGTVYYDNLTIVNLTTTGGNLPPRALISGTPLNGEAPLDVSFIGSTSTDDTAVTQYSWDFGDGQESTLADPEHTYANEGSYTAILTVTDAGGLTDTESILIEVGPSSFECASLNLQAQYSINGEAAVAGQTTVTLTVGDEISLGLLPEGTSFTVSGHVSKTELDENPLNIESIRLEDAGLYRFTTTEGCTLDFELIVEEFDCSTLGLMAQYSINGATAVTGDNSAEINVGDDLRFGLLPEGTIYSISGPQNKPLDANSFLLESAVTEDAGTYILSSSDGCTVEFTLVVNTVECSALNLQVSYSVNGETAVTGANSVTLTEGDDISLFLLPQGSQFSVSGKNSKPLDANALLLEDVEMEDAGPHTFTNEDGCNVTFDILVEPLPLDCSNITAQYSINGATAVTGENSATLSPGDDLRFGLLPEGTLYSISGPRNKPMNANILLLENVETGDAGMYTMTTDTGCKVEFSVVVNNVECNAQNLEMLYSINGAVAVSGASSVTLTEGDAINLSLLPEGTLFSVGGPNSKPMNANALLLDDVAVGDAGFYTFTTQNGCSLPFEILVEPISEECENIMARYSINGATAVTGENAVTLSQGDALTLSLLPEGTLYSINGPNNKPLDTNALLLENVMADDGGTYTLTTEEGCTIPFEVTVIPPTDCPEGNVVVRYTVNGVTTSGENTLALNEGDQVLLDVLPFGLEFTITLPDGQVLTDAFETMAILPEQEGTYLFSAENYCSSTLEVTVTPDPSVSEPTLEDLIIFPNPVTSGTLNVVLEDFMNEAIFIGFHDMYGKLVQQEVIAQDHGATVALDVSKWSSGTYIVIIKRENSSETVFKKVLKFQ